MDNFSISGRLVLNYWPKEDALNTVFVTGKTLLVCDVDSDHPFTLKWYKDGKEVDLTRTSVPLWGYKYKDNTGAAFWHWPYHKDFLSLPTEYECRATNGVDPPVKKKIKYTPLTGLFHFFRSLFFDIYDKLIFFISKVMWQI